MGAAGTAAPEHGCRPGRRRPWAWSRRRRGRKGPLSLRGRLVFRGTQSGKCCPPTGLSAKRKGNGPRWAALEPGGPGPAGGAAGGPIGLGFWGNHKPLRGEGGPGLQGSQIPTRQFIVNLKSLVLVAQDLPGSRFPRTLAIAIRSRCRRPLRAPGGAGPGVRPSLGGRGAGVPEAPLLSPEASHVPVALGGRSGDLPGGCRGGDSGVGGKDPHSGCQAVVWGPPLPQGPRLHREPLPPAHPCPGRSVWFPLPGRRVGTPHPLPQL